MSATTIDCVYYYMGGTQRGTWKRAIWTGAGQSEVFRQAILRMGYHAVFGSTKIGPPEGAPYVRDPDCVCPCCYHKKVTHA